MSSDYRLAPALGARLLGSALVGLAVLILVVTLMVALLDLSVLFVAVVAALGLAAVLVAGHVLTRRMYVVRLGEDGVLHLRPARGIHCLVLRLRDGRTTTIPVQVLAVDRDEFARDVRAHLERSAGGPAPGRT